MIKNGSGQKVGAQMITAADGTPFTGSVTVAITVDAGTQGTGSVGSGACTHEGGGYHTYAPAQAETNGDLVAFTFSGTGAVSTTVQVYTRAATPDVNVTTIAANAITATAIASDAITDAKVASDVTIASVTGAVGSVTGAVGSVTGNVTGSVGSVATGGITASSFAADAITAAKLAADVTTELQSGLATASALSTVSGLVDDLETRLTATRAGYLDNLSAGAVATAAALATVDGIVDDILADTADMQPKLGTPAGASISADIAAIEAQTDDIGVAGAGLTALASAADLATLTGYVDTEVAAIKAKTDNLPAAPAATGDIPSAATIADAVWDEATLGHTTSGTFGEQVKTDIDAILDDTDLIDDGTSGLAKIATDVAAVLVDTGTTLQAEVDDIQSRLPAALTGDGNMKADALKFDGSAPVQTAGKLWVLDGSGNAIPTAAGNADAVWLETLADHSGSAGSTAEALGAAGSAGDPWSTALPGAYGSGSAGKIIGDNINATISSRATQTSVDDLPTNAELATSQAAADDATLAAIAALSIPTVAAIADGVWDESTTGHTTSGTFGEQLKTDVDAILADTNELQTDDYPTTLATLATSAALTTVEGKIDTIDSNVDLALADTAELQTDWANGGRLDLILDARASQSSVDDIPTNAELATALGTADDAVLAAIAALNNLDAAGIRTAVGLASANLDTQLGDLPTNAELATALGTADDAVLSAIAALSILDAAGIRTAVGLASANLDTQLAALPTATENADALLNRTISGGADGGRTVGSAFRAIRNKQAISGGTLTVYEEDDTTSAWTATVTTASGDPIVSVDPS